MADQLQLRGGSTAQTAAFTGALREVTVDTDKKTVVVHDGTTVGGNPLLRQDLSNLPAGTIDNADINASAAIALTKLGTGALPTTVTVASANLVDGTIVNADINTSAAIAGTKVSPNFGSQNIITTGDAQAASLNGGPLAGMRNRIINGAMAIDQRNVGASQTFTSAAALAYSVDRWYGYCTGANVTGQQIAGATAGQFRYRFTGSASVTAIGFGQRIEQLNSADFASTTATLSVDLANSVLTTVTWTAFYATTADTFGTLASPTRTQIATGTFTVNSTVTRYSTNISIPAAATTGIEIVFTVGAQASGTWTIGDVQLEPGTVATPFERRSYGQELVLCQRYYEQVNAFWLGDVTNGITYGTMFTFAVQKRTTPNLASIAQAGAGNGGMNTRSPAAFGSGKGGSTTATAATTTVTAGFTDVYAASAEL